MLIMTMTADSVIMMTMVAVKSMIVTEKLAMMIMIEK